VARPSTQETRTTVMVRNVPNDLTRELFLALLEKLGLAGLYDFVYLPVDFQTGSGLGYAFVNLVDPSGAPRLWAALDGFRRWAVPSRKRCSVAWNEPHQGLSANVMRFRNSAIMHPSVPDSYKPVVFSDGVRAPFPAPTKAIKAAPTASAAVAEETGVARPSTQETRTTVMVRNVPNDLTRELFLALLEKLGLAGLYDFVYLPVDFQTGSGLGYAFVNLVDPSGAPRLWAALDGFRRWAVPSRKRCSVAWNEPHQGLSANVMRFRNSAIMHPSVPDSYKPVVFSDGVRAPFPAPTKAIKAPRLRR